MHAGFIHEIVPIVLYSSIELAKQHKKKTRAHLFLAIKIVLFVCVLVLLWYQLNGIEKSAWLSFGFASPWALIAAVVLVIPNIWIAYRKWLLTLRTIEVRSDQRTKVHSFFAGIVTGLLTPNMLGNFIGRFYYFEKAHRLHITAFTMLSNFGQFLASMSFGLVAIVWLGKLIVWQDEETIIYVLLIVVLMGYLIFFYIDNVLRLFRSMKFEGIFHNFLKKHPWYRTQILMLSFARFMIFTLQFSLMLVAYGADWSLELVAAIWQVYLLTMLAPSLFLGKVGVKESIALFVLSTIGLNELSVLFASLSVWLLNTVSPALLGLVVCRNRSAA